jgi:hypothetical protein
MAILFGCGRLIAQVDVWLALLAYQMGRIVLRIILVCNRE